MEKAIADVRAKGGTVAYVRVGFTEADWVAIPPANRSFAPFAQHRLMHHADPDTAIHERLAPQDGGHHRALRPVTEACPPPTSISGCANTASPLWSSRASVPSGVVLSTVLDAADRDYQLYVLADGVADPDPQAHDVLLHQVFPSPGPHPRNRRAAHPPAD
ncbi:cysteine hydrolase family protein [Nonomuraea dietziae]|uniref:cysteine hydrolase family protein n=1 Tax=Nonomuraea dietziae TaxID=65515 RepID=UPI0031DF9559